MINESAATGFERGAADYERARPDYPRPVLDALPSARGALVVDLAAGTGKLTRQLAAMSASVVGVEPVAAMRAVLARFAPAVAGTADTVVARALSTSYVSAAPDAVRERVARDVRAIVAGFEEPFDYPYVTQIFTCRRA